MGHPCPRGRYLVLAITFLALSAAACSTPRRNRAEPVSTTRVEARPASTVPIGFVALDQLASLCRCHSGFDRLRGRHWISKGSARVELQPASRVAYIEGDLALMREATQEVKGRLFIPQRFAGKLESWARRASAPRHRVSPPLARVEPKPQTKPKTTRRRPSRGQHLRGMTFVIDPGHGGRDPGAIAPNGLREKEVALDVSLQVDRFLQASGARVIMTRDSDHFVELRERAAISNRNQPIAFVSIHANSHTRSGALGIEVFKAMRQESYTKRESSALARALYRRLETVSPHGDRGVKPSPGYQVLRYNKHPAALVELGFLSNWRESAMLDDADYRRRLARAIADGIADYGRSRAVTAGR
ncbi:MAG: N-acetylmuramoyl-L-alanine amidase [Planctomycetota bacterium]